MTARAAPGNLYLAVNAQTLGCSEAELVFHVREAAERLIRAEREARETVSRESPLLLQDRVGRAQGLASGAHLLGYAEGMGILGALRLGAERGLQGDLSLERANEMLLETQHAHLALQSDGRPDILALNAQRAERFRKIAR